MHCLSRLISTECHSTQRNCCAGGFQKQTGSVYPVPVSWLPYQRENKISFLFLAGVLHDLCNALGRNVASLYVDQPLTQQASALIDLRQCLAETSGVCSPKHQHL
jgi:hypothetical protein